MMLEPEHLEVLADGLTAVLGIWLGITVVTRSSAPSVRVFGFLAFALVVWSSSVIVERLSTSASAVEAAHALEELAAALIVPATAHFSLLIATEGHPARRQVRIIVLAYVSNVLFALPGVIDAAAPIAIAPPQVAIGPVPATVLGWAWIVTRLATLLVGAGWLVIAIRRSTEGDPRRRKLIVTLATVAVGAIGGIIRLFSVVSPTEPWIGVSLVTLSMVMAASVVFSSRIFFGPEIAGKAFWTSLAVGLGLFLLVAGLLLADEVSRTVLGLDLPLLAILLLILTITLYQPVTAWARSRSDRRSPAEAERRRLLVALGASPMDVRGADAGVQHALTRVSRALGLTGAAVVRRDGTMAAAEGRAPDDATARSIALTSEDEVLGELRLSRTSTGAPLSPADEELLRLSVQYVSAAMRAGRREDAQAEELTGLTRERAEVESSAASLHEALVRRSTGQAGLRILALGPLRVTRGRDQIDRWGGAKAGTRQAEALFAFLFDRGERGVAKDEALDLIWPDTDVDRADLAFHRTLGALRHTLDPAGAAERGGIRFHNDRYRLDTGLVEWSDVAAFLARLDSARAAADPGERLRFLEEARALYRGEYLDDCPFYGDSVHVEERRAQLRGRNIDLLIALGSGYEEAADRGSAAAAYREAVAAAVDGCPPAEAGLDRLAAWS